MNRTMPRVKGDGLTGNPAALRRWMVADPDMAHLLQEFQCYAVKRPDKDGRHRRHKRHEQIAFDKDVQSLSRTVEEMGNMFSEDSNDLIVLDSRHHRPISC